MFFAREFPYFPCRRSLWRAIRNYMQLGIKDRSRKKKFDSLNLRKPFRGNNIRKQDSLRMEKIGKRRTCLNFPRCTCLVALIDHAPPVRVPSIFNFFQQQTKFFLRPWPVYTEGFNTRYLSDVTGEVNRACVQRKKHLLCKDTAIVSVDASIK